MVIDHFAVAPERFGWVFGAVVLGYVAGAYGGSRAGMRFGLARATGIGSAIGAAAGIGLLLAGWSGLGGLYAITALMALSFFGAGFAIPQGTAGGLGPFPERAGSAAALLGFIQMMTGLLINALSSVWYDGTPRPMATLNALCAMAALAAYLVFLRTPRRG